MQKGLGKKITFLFRLSFPYRHHFQFTKSPLKLYCIGTLGCVFSILCPSPNDAILCIFFQLNVLDGLPKRHIFLQFLYRIHWSDMSNPFISLQCLVQCDVFVLAFLNKDGAMFFVILPLAHDDVQNLATFPLPIFTIVDVANNSLSRLSQGRSRLFHARSLCLPKPAQY